jgi:hypothetical protein
LELTLKPAASAATATPTRLAGTSAATDKISKTKLSAELAGSFYLLRKL